MWPFFLWRIRDAAERNLTQLICLPLSNRGWRDIKREGRRWPRTGRKGTREEKGGKRAAGKQPQACKSRACPASRAKKEPGVSSRGISGLMNGRPYRSEARSWRDAPLCAVDSRQSWEIFATGDTGRLPVETGIRVLAHRAEEWTSGTHKHSSK